MTALKAQLLGVCYVGQHIKKTGYVLLRFALEKAKGWHVQVEPPFIPISNEEMKTRGLSVVLDYLRNTPDSDSCKQLSYFDEVTKKVMSKLKRNHALVNVTLLLNDYEELEMIPLHAGHGLWRFDTRAEEVRIYRLPMTNETFMAHLTEALEIAS